MSIDRIPTTVISGGLGAGKTTLLNHLLSSNEKRDLAVVVNDMGELNVDQRLVENHVDLGGDSELLGLQNGCICCGLQGDLRDELFSLAHNHEFDHLVIEASGISEPVGVAGLFVGRGPVGDLYDLDTTVTVVDTPQFAAAFGEATPERENPETGPRPLSDLLIEQIEFCDVLVANKRDRLADEEHERIERLLRALQPDAELLWTSFSEISPEKILGTELFDPERAQRSAGWKQALEAHSHAGHEHADHDHDETDHTDHVHPPEEYGVDSVVFETPHPLHPERFLAWLRDPPADLVRTKGMVWVAGREDYALSVGQAGEYARIETNGRWIASLPDEQRTRHRDPTMSWDERWGDRGIQLVCIGVELDEKKLVESLKNCLLTDDELEDDWDRFENAFPSRPGVGTVLEGEEPVRSVSSA
jgi:G3E family GTPase